MSSVDPAIMELLANAARVSQIVQEDLARVRTITKDDRSPVTVADFAVQALVLMGLEEIEPGVAIVGEEAAGELRNDDNALVRDEVVSAVRKVRPEASVDAVLDAIDRGNHDASGGRYWTLDPIDGTKGFLRGQQYAIALGLIEDGAVTFGAMACPNLSADSSRPLDVADDAGTIFMARRGEGASCVAAAAMNEAPKTVKAKRWSAGNPVRVCESVEAAHSKHDDVVAILKKIGAERVPVRLDSQCKYGVVARGQANAYLRMPTKKGYVEKIWDHAAGSLIAQEAGAIVTDIAGEPLDYSQGERLERNRGVVCASEGLHAKLVSAIRELGLAAPVEA